MKPKFRRTHRGDGLPAEQARRVLEYIERNLGKPMTVPELSALVNRDNSHFSRKFRQTFGAPPYDYVLRHRIQLASRLLIESCLPLSQIALICGFGDQPHFSGRFKKATGTTPTAWRRARNAVPTLGWGGQRSAKDSTTEL